MSGVSFRVVWICGAPGSGKSVTSWWLWRELVADGLPAAYVDIDQLGMLYPEEPSDPHRYALKVATLSAVVPRYRAAGARILLVSGVIDPVRGAAEVTAAGESVPVTVCLLTTAEEELRRRLDKRGWSLAAQDSSVANQTALLSADVADVILESAGRSPEELAADIRPLLASRHDCGSVKGTSGPRLELSLM